jgi:hypothetical protein
MMTRSQTRIAELEARIAELEKENEKLKKRTNALLGFGLDEPLKSTKNTKDNRVCVVVKYSAPEAIFKIPDGLDLEDKSVVESWWVKYGTLYICYTNGKEKEIEWDNSADYKWGIGEYRTGKIVKVDYYDNELYDEDEDKDEDSEDENEDSDDEN